MLSAGICAWFQATPKESHYVAVKWIFRYLAHTPNFGLWYPRGANFNLVGFSDSDWAGDKVDRKSTSGGCQFLGRSLGVGLQRSKIVYPSRRPKPSILPPKVVVLSYYRWGKLWRIMVSNVTKCLFDVTMKVQSRSPRIRFNIARQSILRFAIISLEILWPRETLNYSMSTPRIN